MVEPQAPGRLPARADLLDGLGQEAAGNGAVGVEGDAELAQCREDLRLLQARDGGVVALVDGGEDEVVRAAVVVRVLDLGGAEVGESEAAEKALGVGGVDAAQLRVEVDGGVGTV